ncbi:MAG TPA: histidine phosphotransferase family protein [Rhizomicrobium sp.]|jgi:histidine phosphotransferase ChpT|nr:histidine phosphotransferase family protein [Rhizomicrobium sp.]
MESIARGKTCQTMNDLDFAALLVSRVCHDLVSPVGAVVNGLEVLEEERDGALRADALKLVTSSASLAAARLQFARIAFGTAGSAGAELDLTEVGRMVGGFLSGGKSRLAWNAAPVNWPKDWAKLLMNCAVIAADALPRGGTVSVSTGGDVASPAFAIRASGQGARIHEEALLVLRGEPSLPFDGRSIQPYLTYKLAKLINTPIQMTCDEGSVILAAGEMRADSDGG